jgi:hypothetical protein
VHGLQPEELVPEPVLQLGVLRLNALEPVVCILKKDVKTMKLLRRNRSSPDFKKQQFADGKRIKKIVGFTKPSVKNA